MERSFDGERITKSDTQTIRDIGLGKMVIISHRFPAFPLDTIRDYVAFGLKAYGIANNGHAEKAMKSLKREGLDPRANRPPSSLYHVIQQRFAVAYGLVVGPDEHVLVGAGEFQSGEIQA